MIGDRWGVGDADVARRYPCDEFVPAPALQVWRGVTVEAGPDRLWPWVAQVRLAPYSYDWIDNLGRRSPRRLRALPEPKVGDRFTTAAAAIPVGRIVAVTPGVQLTGRMLADLYLSYVLLPEDDTRTRLLLKIVAGRHRTVGPLISLADLVMARRQLLNFKELAEQPDRRPDERR